ncbi:unnamed protein product, partial [Rotaria sp. Silwood2]
TIDNNHETASAVIGKANDEDGGTEVCMDAENSSDEPMDDASVETDLMSGGSNIVNKVDKSSSEDESFDDSTVNDDQVEDEERTVVEDNKVVSSFRCILPLRNFTLKMDTTGSDESLNQQNVEIPIEIAIFSRK